MFHSWSFVFRFRQRGCSPSTEKLLASTPPPHRRRAKEGNRLLISRHPPPNTGPITQSLLHQRSRPLTVLTPPLKEKPQRWRRPRRLVVAQKRLLSSIQHRPGPPHSQRLDYRPVVHFKTNIIIFYFNFQKLHTKCRFCLPYWALIP